MFRYTLTWLFAKLHIDERGQDVIEYAMLGGLIALGILGVLLLFDTAISSMVTGIGNCIDFNSATVCDPI